MDKCFTWQPKTPRNMGVKFRAALEALAYLIALGVRQHEECGQKITRISLSGGLARSRLMCEILASVLNRSLDLLVSDEGPALGAALTAFAALENHRRKQTGGAADFPVAGAVDRMVKFRTPASPNPEWVAAYDRGLREFQRAILKIRKGR